MGLPKQRPQRLFTAPAKKTKKGKGDLPKTFDCLFCNEQMKVTVTLDKKVGLGSLSCSACGEHFQTPINHLEGAVDVFSAWVDACDAVAQEAAAEKVAVKVKREEDDDSCSSQEIRNVARRYRTGR